MTAVGVVAECAVEACFACGFCEDARARHPMCIIRVVDEEHRRKILQWKEFGNDLSVFFKIGGIDGNGEIRSCTDFVDVVDRRVGLKAKFEEAQIATDDGGEA